METDIRDAIVLLKKKGYTIIAPTNSIDEVLDEWLAYKKERKQTYKSERSLKLCRKKLVELSNGNPKIAKEIVEQSMANNWAGLFPLQHETKTSPVGVVLHEVRTEYENDKGW